MVRPSKFELLGREEPAVVGRLGVVKSALTTFIFSFGGKCTSAWSCLAADEDGNRAPTLPAFLMTRLAGCFDEVLSFLAPAVVDCWLGAVTLRFCLGLPTSDLFLDVLFLSGLDTSCRKLPDDDCFDSLFVVFLAAVAVLVLLAGLAEAGTLLPEDFDVCFFRRGCFRCFFGLSVTDNVFCLVAELLSLALVFVSFLARCVFTSPSESEQKSISYSSGVT